MTLNDEGGETITRIGLCRGCLRRRMHRRRNYGLILLMLLWLPTLIYCYTVARNESLDPYWQFASAAPADS